MIQKVFSRKSEVLMFSAGICILASVITVALTGDFIFWKFAKFFYMSGVALIIFDR